MRERLYRSRSDRMLFGVAGGMAEWLDLDPSVVRLVWALLILAGGIGLLLYIVAAIVVPEEPYGLAAAAPAADAANPADQVEDAGPAPRAHGQAALAGVHDGADAGAVGAAQAPRAAVDGADRERPAVELEVGARGGAERARVALERRGRPGAAAA